MNLIIDIGNSQTKCALMEYGNILDHGTFTQLDKNSLDSFISNRKLDQIIVSTIGDLDPSFTDDLKKRAPLHLLSHESTLNFKNNYATPHTLGKDRIALIAAAEDEFPQQNVLVIDAGTCITYDFKDQNGVYQGGAISPGLQMRLKALHHYTKKLPLVQAKPMEEYIGNSTESNILSGVVNGITQELEGVINQYNQRFTNLNVVLTGGDEVFFAECIKNDFFARPYFLLKGLSVIAEINA